MIPAIQTVQGISVATPLTATQRIAQLAQVANLSSAGPSAIVTLGTVTPASVTYKRSRTVRVSAAGGTRA